MIIQASENVLSFEGNVNFIKVLSKIVLTSGPLVLPEMSRASYIDLWLRLQQDGSVARDLWFWTSIRGLHDVTINPAFVVY